MQTPSNLVKVLSHLLSGGVVSRIVDKDHVEAWKIFDGEINYTIHGNETLGVFHPINFSLLLMMDAQYTLEPIRSNNDAQPVKIATDLMTLKAIYAYTRHDCETVQYSHLNKEFIFDAHSLRYERNTDYDRHMN